MNIRVELLARIEKSVKDEFAFGNESIPQSHWYNIEKRYESTGELGTLIQITQFTDNRRAQAVVLMDSGEFVEVDGLDTIKALEEVAEQMCKYCDGSIHEVENKDYVHVDTTGRTIRIKAYPEGYDDGTCIYIRRKFCHECGRKLAAE